MTTLLTGDDLAVTQTRPGIHWLDCGGHQILHVLENQIPGARSAAS